MPILPAKNINYDAIRPETVPEFDPNNPVTSEWSECDTCKKIVNIDELAYDDDAPVEECFTHEGHIA